MRSVGAVLLCGGRGSRIGCDKVLEPLLGTPVFCYSLKVFKAVGIDEVVVVYRDPEQLTAMQEAAKDYKVTWVRGGERRQDSVKAGLESLTDIEYTLIHDGARPLVTVKLVREILKGLEEYEGVIPGKQVVDTIKEVDKGAPLRLMGVNRDKLWAVESPQGFRHDLIQEAYRSFDGEATDDSSVILAGGHGVRILEHEEINFKITRPGDMDMASYVLEKRRKEDVTV